MLIETTGGNVSAYHRDGDIFCLRLLHTNMAQTAVELSAEELEKVIYGLAEVLADKKAKDFIGGPLGETYKP